MLTRDIPMLKRIALLLSIVTVLNAPPVRAQAAQVRLTIPVDETQVTTDPCSGEAVLLSFSGFIAIHLVLNDNVAVGQTQIKLHGDGTGISSGTPYILNSALASSQNYGAALDGTIVATVIQTLEFISVGGGSNLLAEARNHITINADGTVTVSTDVMTSACRG